MVEQQHAVGSTEEVLLDMEFRFLSTLSPEDFLKPERLFFQLEQGNILQIGLY